MNLFNLFNNKKAESSTTKVKHVGQVNPIENQYPIDTVTHKQNHFQGNIGFNHAGEVLKAMDTVRKLDVEACAGKWQRAKNIEFGEVNQQLGLIKASGKTAVQHASCGNCVVSFRCKNPVDAKAITVFPLLPPLRLDNRMSVAVVSQEYSIHGISSNFNSSNSQMVCNGATGVGVILNRQNFKYETSSDEDEDYSPIVVQIDMLRRELLLFQKDVAVDMVDEVEDEDCNSVDAIPVSPKKSLLNKSNVFHKRSEVYGTPVSVGGSVPVNTRFYNPRLDKLIARTKIPVHWKSTFFAVDLYGRKDEVKVGIAAKWVLKKRRESKECWSQQITSKQRKMLLDYLSNEIRLETKDSTNATPKYNWACGYVPLLTEKRLLQLCNGKGYVNLTLSVRFQWWLYRFALATKPVIDGPVPKLREGRVSTVESIPLAERGVTLALLKDLPWQCGVFSVDDTTSVKQVISQVIAWCISYGSSAAEILASYKGYIGRQQTLTGQWDLLNSKPTKYLRYVSSEIHQPTAYISYIRELKWKNLVGANLFEGVASPRSFDTIWIDVACFNFTEHLLKHGTVSDINSTINASETIISDVGKVIWVIDPKGNCFTSAKFCYEGLFATQQEISLSNCFTADSLQESCIYALLAAAGRFDKTLFSYLANDQYEVYYDKFENLCGTFDNALEVLESCIRKGAVDYLKNCTFSFSDGEIDQGVTLVQQLKLSNIISKEGEPIVAGWMKLTEILFATG